jgi:hypothetical protein
VTSTPGTRPRDHGIPTFDYLVEQSSGCFGRCGAGLATQLRPAVHLIDDRVPSGTRERGAGPDSPEIYRGCRWAPDTLAPAHFAGPLAKHV